MKLFVKGLLLPLKESLNEPSFADANDIISIAEGVFHCICDFFKEYNYPIEIKLYGGENQSIYEVYNLLKNKSIQPRFLKGVVEQLEENLPVLLLPKRDDILNIE